MISLKYRIAGTIFLLEAIMLIVVLGYILSTYWQQNIDRLNHEEKIVLNMISEFGRVALLTGDFTSIQVLLERRKDDHVLNIALLDINNQVVASSSPSFKSIDIAVDETRNENFYWKTVDIKNAAGKFGSLAIQFSNAEFIALHNQVRNRSVLLGVTGMLIIAVIAVSVGRLLTRRLEKVTQAAYRFAQGEKTEIRTNMTGNDEIAKLAYTFDQMVEDKLNSETNLEKQVRERTAALQESNKELEAFSYSVSHDLRAPLRAIDGFSQLLLDEYSKNLDKDGKYYLQRIRVASQNMGQLIDDLLVLSRVGRHEIHLSKVDISQEAKKILDQLRELSPQRSIEFSVKSGLVVQGDEKLLHLVMENLIGNAWKYTSKTENGVIEVGSMNDDTVYVRDNGAGFDMSYVDKLFRPFHRLHGPDEFEGTGIGLATVSRIIGKHGGKVWCEGKVGHGATFYFKLLERNQ